MAGALNGLSNAFNIVNYEKQSPPTCTAETYNDFISDEAKLIEQAVADTIKLGAKSRSEGRFNLENTPEVSNLKMF